MSEVVYRPAQPHRCRVVPDMRKRAFEVDGQTAWLEMAMQDQPGTVRRCECGRTMVARRPLRSAGYVAAYVVYVPEGRLARWWRERRHGPPAAQRRERSELPK